MSWSCVHHWGPCKLVDVESNLETSTKHVEAQTLCIYHSSSEPITLGELCTCAQGDVKKNVSVSIVHN